MDNLSENKEYSWPNLYYNRMPLSCMIKSAGYSLNPLVLPSDLVEYLMLICDKMKFSNACLQLTLSILSRFLKRRPNAIPLQLVGLTSLIIASKVIQSDRPEMNQYHSWSCNSFTNKDFYRAEKMILMQLNFDILQQGVPHRSITMVAHCIKSIIDVQFTNIFDTILEQIERVAWYYIYIGRIKMRQGRDKHITAAIVHSTLIFLTQFSGKFIHTLWACQMTEAKEKEVISLSNRFIKQIIGEQKCKTFKL